MDAEEIIKKCFPNLINDPLFKVKSKPDKRYNCIGWALLYDNRWVWPPNSFFELDGVYYFWPQGVKDYDLLEAFVELFQSEGYEICEDVSHEPEYRKIALYVDPSNGKCTHAARQNRVGVWLSKLGAEHDISHQNPYSLEGIKYGVVGVLMKKRLI